MGQARKRKHYTVDLRTDVIGYNLMRGDTVFCLDDNTEYIHRTNAKTSGMTLKRLADSGNKVSDNSEDEINVDEVEVDEVETTEEDINIEDEEETSC